MDNQAFRNLLNRAPTLEHAGLGALLWLGLNGPASQLFLAILGFAVFTVVIYVLKPVAKTLGDCLAKQIEMKLTPPVPPKATSSKGRRRRKPKSPPPQHGMPAHPP